jgi:23S rRNA (guanosine2251-2'-O)-methyltransferase
MLKSTQKYLILHNIRSVHNTGAIFRTADALGIDKIYLIGETATPFDRFGRPRSDFVKTALGSEKTMPWEYFRTIAPVLKKLKKQGFSLYAIEQSPTSVDYKKVKPAKLSACILGSETRGIPPSVLSQVDHVLEIPMRGMKESLNVSVAAGIVLYRLFDK